MLNLATSVHTHASPSNFDGESGHLASTSINACSI